MQYIEVQDQLDSRNAYVKTMYPKGMVKHTHIGKINKNKSQNQIGIYNIQHAIQFDNKQRSISDYC